MMVDRSTWTVDECPSVLVSPLITEYHYLHRMPAVTPCCMAVTNGSAIMGAVVWGLPPVETATRLGGVAWELARLWLADELPRNSESWVIARAVRHVRSAHPGIRYLVSYADPAVGHSGTIYRAANWRYDGMTDSDRLTPRYDYWLGGVRLGRATHAGRFTAEKRRRSPKHRFIYDLGGKREGQGSTSSLAFPEQAMQSSRRSRRNSSGRRSHELPDG